MGLEGNHSCLKIWGTTKDFIVNQDHSDPYGDNKGTTQDLVLCEYRPLALERSERPCWLKEVGSMTCI